MKEACAELAPLLAARPLGILERDDEARVETHVAGCVDCASLVLDLDRALVEATCPPVAAPASARSKLLERIAADRSATDRDARAGAVSPQPTLVVLLSCTYCHDSLARKEAAFCAGCLAPCHEDCFESHGRCSAPGCGETRLVKPSETSARRSRPLLVAALFVVGSAAAFVALESRREATTEHLSDVPAHAPSVPVPLSPAPPLTRDEDPFHVLTPASGSPATPRRDDVDARDKPRVESVPRAPAPRSGDGETPAPADEDRVDTCSGDVVDFVDFSKLPGDVEGQNKVRIGIQPTVDPQSRHLSIDVEGNAFYPDGVTITVGIRHAKARSYFDQKRVTVKDHSFHYTLGPYTKALPAGGLVVEATFLLAMQSPQIQQTLVRGGYFHCAPPCKHDKANRTEVHYSVGGEDAERASVEAEKRAIGEALAGIVSARKACESRLATLGPKGSSTALDDLANALERVSTKFNEWRRSRQFMLFQERAAELTALKLHVTEALKARAVLLGASVPGQDLDKARSVEQDEEKEVARLVASLEAFLREPDSLEKAFEAGSKRK